MVQGDTGEMAREAENLASRISEDGSCDEETDAILRIRKKKNPLVGRMVGLKLLDCGKRERASHYLYHAALLGDTESAMKVLADRRISDGCGTTQWQDATFDCSMSSCDGFYDAVSSEAERNDHVAAILAMELRRYGGISDPEYVKWRDISVGRRIPCIMHLAALDLLEPGFRGDAVDADASISLLEDSAPDYWKSDMSLASLHFVGRYVDRDDDAALDHVMGACRKTSSETSPRDWLRYMVDDTDDDRLCIGGDGEFEFPDIPECTVLRDLTMLGKDETPYEALSDWEGAFSTDLFTFGGEETLFLFSPTGLKVTEMGCISTGATEGLSVREWRKLLGICIEDARNAIRELDA